MNIVFFKSTLTCTKNRKTKQKVNHEICFSSSQNLIAPNAQSTLRVSNFFNFPLHNYHASVTLYIPSLPYFSPAGFNQNNFDVQEQCSIMKLKMPLRRIYKCFL